MSSETPAEVGPDHLLASRGAGTPPAIMGLLRVSDALLHMHIPQIRQKFSPSNLVSDDQAGHLSAQIQDPNLINPWGITFAPGGPFWTSNNHTGTSTLYSVNPTT